MHKKFGFGLLTLALTLASCGTTNQSAQPTESANRPSPSMQAPLLGTDKPDAIPGQYIVVLHDGAEDQNLSAQSAGGLMKSLNLDPAGVTMKHMYAAALNGFAAKLSAQNLQTLRADPRVKYIEQDGMMYGTATQSGATWGLDRIDQRNLPLSKTYTYDNMGAGVTAYVIDTGIRTTHSEFGGRAVWGTNTVGDGRNTDCAGHGTHVAGTVGGKTYGVAKGVKLVAVKVLGCNNQGENSGVIAGINWVATNKSGPAVANMSIGGTASQAVDDSVNNMIAKGVTAVIAAGNSNDDACKYSPARVTNGITVMNSTSSDARSSSSSYGRCADIYAPGASITSSWFSSDTSTNTISGTSMASPHVAGAVAVMLSGNPTLTPAQVATQLYTNATPNKITNAGTGSPNRLLFIPTGVTPPANTAPVANFTSSVSGLSVSFSSTSTDAENNISTYTWNFGDGTTATGATASKTYAAAGTYTVTLTVTDAGGLSSTSTQSVTVSGGTTPTPGNETFTGTISTSGSYNFHNNSTGFYYAGGTIRGSLSHATGRDFDLYLQKQNADGTWTYVIKAATASNPEVGSYAAPAGTYRWIVHSYSGTGSYTLTVTK